MRGKEREKERKMGAPGEELALCPRLGLPHEEMVLMGDLALEKDRQASMWKATVGKRRRTHTQEGEGSNSVGLLFFPSSLTPARLLHHEAGSVFQSEFQKSVNICKQRMHICKQFLLCVWSLFIIRRVSSS